jgi:uncharacterized protein
VNVDVVVKPGSKQPGIALTDGTIVMRVRERAVEGNANAACIGVLAEALRVAPSSVTLIRGARGRRKVFAVEGLSVEDIRAKLAAHVAKE